MADSNNNSDVSDDEVRARILSQCSEVEMMAIKHKLNEVFSIRNVWRRTLSHMKNLKCVKYITSLFKK